jgi:hypothetical protein
VGRSFAKSQGNFSNFCALAPYGRGINQLCWDFQLLIYKQYHQKYVHTC